MKSTPPMNLSVRTKPSNHTIISNSSLGEGNFLHLVTNMPMVARHQLFFLVVYSLTHRLAPNLGIYYRMVDNGKTLDIPSGGLSGGFL